MKFKEKEIELPNFTIDFEEKLEELEKMNHKFVKGEISRVEVLKKCYIFLANLLSEKKLLEILNAKKMEEVDMRELELLFFKIKTEYEKPLDEAILQKEKEKLKKMFKDPDIREAILLNKNLNKQKR